MIHAIHWLYRGVAWTWGGYPFRSGAAGYNIFSGPLPDVVFVGSVYGLYRKHNCHVDGCWRVGHIDPEHGHPACKHHHTRRHLLGDDPHARA